jgi:hypothetical protein
LKEPIHRYRRKDFNQYGPSIAALKGKTVRRSPEQVVTNLIKVPKQILKANANVSLSADIFFVNTIPFFTSIKRNIKFTTSENVPTRTASQLVRSMRHVLAIYKKRGFHVDHAMMDGEFAPLKAEMLALGVSLNIASANEHVPEIERWIRVLKERTQATRHTLPFPYIPKVMLVAMVANARWRFSYTQSENGTDGRVLGLPKALSYCLWGVCTGA